MVRSDRGQGEQSHAGQSTAQLGGIESPVRSDDVPEMRSGDVVAPIQDLLQSSQIVIGLEHHCSPLQALSDEQRGQPGHGGEPGARVE